MINVHKYIQEVRIIFDIILFDNINIISNNIKKMKGNQQNNEK